MTTYRLFPATNGPAAVATTSGGWLLGVQFSALTVMGWLNGYYLWVPNNGDTTPVKWALWNYNPTAGAPVLVPGSTVTSGTLTAGAWNFTPLANPVQLGAGAQYVAATGWNVTSGIPVTSGQFSAAQPFGAGITNGPLTAWSSGTGTNAYPTPGALGGQMVFSNVLGSDPAVAMPNNGSGDDNLWVDIQVSDTAPVDYAGSYRLYPNTADVGNFALDTATGFTLGKQFSLSRACTANNAWFYSPATVSVLPSAAGFYRTSDQSLVAVNNSPSWSGAAGGGWVSAPFTGVTLPAGTYKYVVFQGSNAIWNVAVANYYTTGFGGSGLTAGPITVPNNASALSPGQESYHQGAALAYPDTSAGPFAYGLDLEVTPTTTASSSGVLLACFP